MTTGKKREIFEAMAARLQTIKTANGYATDVKNVYYDQIPMGIELNDYQLPVIFLLDRADILTTEFPTLKGSWEVDLQLWHKGSETDSTMMDFVGDVFRAIYANSPTAQVNNYFRMHPSIVEIKPASIAGDLNMIEANRVYEVSFSIHYRSKLFEL